MSAVCACVCLQVSVCVRRVLQVDSVIVVRLDSETFLSVLDVSVTCPAASTPTPAGPAPAR